MRQTLLTNQALNNYDDHLLIVDDGAGGTERKSEFTRVKKYIFSAVSGDATASDSGALTIANDAVEQAMIADDAVGADQLASSAVVTASIVDDAVTQAKIADDAVGADQLAANAVVNASIASSAAIADSKLDTISTAGKVALTALEIDGGTDIGADLTTSDLIIVDEASQVSIAQAFPALIRAKKVLVLGDRKQYMWTVIQFFTILILIYYLIASNILVLEYQQ